jgi:PAS domain S-box-containing protein
MNAPRPEDEGQRLKALRRYEVLDTAPEPALERITREAAQIFGVPICLVSLVDENRAWFKSRYGWGVPEIGREVSFCAHAILSEDVMVVADARQDARFAQNPLVTGELGIRFYAGAVLRSPDGFNLGTLCILDRAAHLGLSQEEAALLKSLAGLVMSEFEAQLLMRLRGKAERERRETEGLLAWAFRSAPWGLTITDQQGRFVQVNEAYCQLLGCGEAELIGQPFLDTLSPESRELAERTGALEVEAQWEGPTEWRIQRRDSSLVDVRAASAPLVGGEGARFRVTALSDITLHKQLEEYLRWTEKMEALRGLAGKVAHSFGHLLTIITGFGQLIKNSVEAEHPLSGYAHEILKASERASVLTSQFLMLSGRRAGTPQALDLNAVILSLEGSLRQIIGPEIALVTALEPDLRKVSAYPPQVVQLIMNLVVNAREAMPGGGKIILDTFNIELGEDFVRTHPSLKPGAYVLLTVQDSGEGMDEETRKHLFEPFFTRKGAGRGTGLATVYGIVKECGGLISVWSTPGKGTTVDVFLPALPETVEPRKPEAQEEAVSVTAINPVEDSEAAQRAPRYTFEGEGSQSVAHGSAGVVDSVHRPRGIRATLSSAALVLTLAASMGILGDALKPRWAIEAPGGAEAGPRSMSALGLAVRLEGGQVLLSWNWQAEPIKTADRAILSITDGGRREDVELDPVVLRTKKLAYSPVTNDVSFRLQVADSRRHTTASESVRVLGARPNPLAVPVQHHPAGPAASASR